MCMCGTGAMCVVACNPFTNTCFPI
jgi:hypothetical protein